MVAKLTGHRSGKISSRWGRRRKQWPETWLDVPSWVVKSSNERLWGRMRWTRVKECGSSNGDAVIGVLQHKGRRVWRRELRPKRTSEKVAGGEQVPWLLEWWHSSDGAANWKATIFGKINFTGGQWALLMAQFRVGFLFRLWIPCCHK